ncbi:MAG TPA: hypothetical protein VF531_15315, partial [Bacillota bacterium]
LIASIASIVTPPIRGLFRFFHDCRVSALEPVDPNIIHSHNPWQFLYEYLPYSQEICGER